MLRRIPSEQIELKDGRVLGKHLELKKMGFTTNYRNLQTTNTSVT